MHILLCWKIFSVSKNCNFLSRLFLTHYAAAAHIEVLSTHQTGNNNYTFSTYAAIETLKRHCTLAIHLTLLIYCNIINPQCPRALLPVSYLQFHGITYPLVLVPFMSLLREFGTP